MIVGVIEAEAPIVPREVLHRQDGADTLDWLYE
jgi:hypothetical protein